MKNLLLTLTLFLILATAAFSQQYNPDGYGPSIHFTPYINWGSYSDKSIDHDFDYDLNLGYGILLKVPLSNSFTLSAFYDKSPFTISSSTGAIIANDKSVLADGSNSAAGLRVSIYFGSR